jgi:peptidyl-tRNA hydrolase
MLEIKHTGMRDTTKCSTIQAVYRVAEGVGKKLNDCSGIVLAGLSRRSIHEEATRLMVQQMCHAGVIAINKRSKEIAQKR